MRLSLAPKQGPLAPRPAPATTAATAPALLPGAMSGGPQVTRERLVAAPDRHIAVPDSHLLQHFKGYVGGGKEEQQLQLLQQLLLGIARQQQAPLCQDLVEGFDTLSSLPPAERHPDFATKVPTPAPPPPSPTPDVASDGGNSPPISASAGATSGRQQAQGAEQQQQQQAARQLAFLRQLCAAMEAGGYRLLTREEYDAALCEDFLFTLPVTADYSIMDATLLPPLWEQQQGAGARRELLPPQLADRALMWHRGAEAVRASTPAWALKLDLLVSFWVLQPLWAALAWLAALVGLRLPVRARPGISTRPYAAPPAGPQPSATASSGNGAEPDASQPTAGGGGSGSEGQVGGMQVPATRTEAGDTAGGGGRVIERRTFARAFPNGRAVWRQLMQPVQLQEACFRDVVLLYRPAAVAEAAAEAAAHRGRQAADQLARARPAVGPAAVPAAAGGKGPEDAQGRVDWLGEEERQLPTVEESVGGASDDAGLVLKQFRRVPLADLEMVLPGTNVFLPPNLYLSLAFTVAGGLVTVFLAMWQGAWEAGLLKSMATIMLSRAYQVYFSATSEHNKIIKHMTQMLYQRTAASQTAVLHTLTAELAGQRARELLLCYCTLLAAGQPLSELDVEGRCQRLLQRQFGQQHVQFAAAAPLRQLQQWGLLESAGASLSGGGGEAAQVAAVPLGEAVEKLQQVWASLAEAVGEPAGGQAVRLPRLPASAAAEAADVASAQFEAPGRPAGTAGAAGLAAGTSGAGDGASTAAWQQQAQEQAQEQAQAQAQKQQEQQQKLVQQQEQQQPAGEPAPDSFGAEALGGASLLAAGSTTQAVPLSDTAELDAPAFRPAFHPAQEPATDPATAAAERAPEPAATPAGSYTTTGPASLAGTGDEVLPGGVATRAAAAPAVTLATAAGEGGAGLAGAGPAAESPSGSWEKPTGTQAAAAGSDGGGSPAAARAAATRQAAEAEAAADAEWEPEAAWEPVHGAGAAAAEEPHTPITPRHQADTQKAAAAEGTAEASGAALHETAADVAAGHQAPANPTVHTSMPAPPPAALSPSHAGTSGGSGAISGRPGAVTVGRLSPGGGSTGSAGGSSPRAGGSSGRSILGRLLRPHHGGGRA